MSQPDAKSYFAAKVLFIGTFGTITACIMALLCHKLTGFPDINTGFVLGAAIGAYGTGYAIAKLGG